jgi:hypothetical protein
MKNIRYEIKWAIIFECMMLVWITLELLAGLHDKHIDKHAIYTNLVAIPAVITYVLAIKDKKINYFKGSMTYKQGLICGILISVFVMILTPLIQIITSLAISPQYFTNAINYTVSNNLMTEAEAKANFNLKNYLILSTIFAPVMGIITSAIVAWFLKTKPQSVKQN